jgi:hypothetical protein
MKSIHEEGEGAVAPVNNTSGVASLNPNDPRNPPVGLKKKKSPKLLATILRRKDGRLKRT